MKDLLPGKHAEIVLEILSDQLGVQASELTPEAKLSDDLAADSLDLVQVTMALEDRLKITIPDERAEHVKTVGDLFEMISELSQ
jgi:acyl carrier protein